MFCEFACPNAKVHNILAVFTISKSLPTAATTTFPTVDETCPWWVSCTIAAVVLAALISVLRKTFCRRRIIGLKRNMGCRRTGPLIHNVPVSLFFGIFVLGGIDDDVTNDDDDDGGGDDDDGGADDEGDC